MSKTKPSAAAKHDGRGRPERPVNKRLGIIVPMRFSRDQYRVLSDSATTHGERFLTEHIRKILAASIPGFLEATQDGGQKD